MTGTTKKKVSEENGIDTWSQYVCVYPNLGLVSQTRLSYVCVYPSLDLASQARLSYACVYPSLGLLSQAVDSHMRAGILTLA